MLLALQIKELFHKHACNPHYNVNYFQGQLHLERLDNKA